MRQLSRLGFSFPRDLPALSDSPVDPLQGDQTPAHGAVVKNQVRTGLNVEAHRDSRGTHGARRIPRRVVKGSGLRIARSRVIHIMREAACRGVPHWLWHRHRPDTSARHDQDKQQFIAGGRCRV